MSKSKEARRFHLRQEAARAMDEEAADELMESLPPIDWTEFATKQDLGAMEERNGLRLQRLEATMRGGHETLAVRLDEHGELIRSVAHGQEQVEEQVVAAREQIAGLGGRVTGLEGEVGGLRQEVGGLRQEVGGLRQEMTEAIGGLRQETNGAIGGLRQEGAALRQEISGLRQDFVQLHSDLRNWGTKVMFGCITGMIGAGGLVLAATRLTA